MVAGEPVVRLGLGWPYSSRCLADFSFRVSEWFWPVESYSLNYGGSLDAR